MPIYIFYYELNKRKRNQALNAFVYKVYHSYHVVQSSIIIGRTNFAAMSKSTKSRKKRSTNMPRVLLKALQATIAFACIDSSSFIQRGAFLCEGAIEDPFAYPRVYSIVV